MAEPKKEAPLRCDNPDDILDPKTRYLAQRADRIIELLEAILYELRHHLKE